MFFEGVQNVYNLFYVVFHSFVVVCDSFNDLINLFIGWKIIFCFFFFVRNGLLVWFIFLDYEQEFSSFTLSSAPDYIINVTYKAHFFFKGVLDLTSSHSLKWAAHERDQKIHHDNNQ